RPLHAAGEAHQAQLQLPLLPRVLQPHLRRGARGGRAAGRAGQRASGGHRTLPPRVLEAHLEDGFREEPELPRGVLRRPPRRGRCPRPGRLRRQQGQAPAHGRSRGGVDHRGAAAALALVPERRQRPHRAAAERVRQRRGAQRQGGAQPRQARDLPRPPAGHGAHVLVLRDGGPRGRRLHARQGGAAPRDLARGGHREGDPHPAQEPGGGGLQPHRAGRVGLRPHLPLERHRLRPRQGEGAPRHVRLRRLRRRRLARHAPQEPGRSVQAAHHPVRRRPRQRHAGAGGALAPGHGRHRHPHDLPPREVARSPQGLEGRQAPDVGPGLDRRRPRRGLVLPDALRPQLGPGEPRALPPAGLRPPLREGAAPSRQPREDRALPRDEPHLPRLLAVAARRAPLLQRPRAPLGDRLPAPPGDARFLEVHRHRRGKEGGRPMKLILQLLLAFLGCAPAFAAMAAELKVLRIPFLIAETNFDPAFTSDLYSNTVIEEILEPPLTYDFLARPAKLKPLTLAAMPEITAGGRTDTLHVKPGLYFAVDPAFGGKKRELVAANYEFAMKRLMDPKGSSPNLWLIEGRIAGIPEAIAKAKKAGRFDYDARVSGIEVVDRYTLRIHLVKPDYNFDYILAMCTVGAQAREVAEKYGDDIGAHPVGTGPYRLAEWKRSSKIVLVRNEGFREMRYDGEPPEGDALSQELLRENKGKRMPMVDRVEISIIEESQPRWLAFLNKELDWINLPYEFINTVLPGGKEAPWAVKRGIRYMPDVDADLTYLYWNMKDPTFGGYTADKVALRRAVGLGYDNQEEINLLRNGTAIEAQGLIPPGVVGYDPNFNTGRSYDPA